MEDNLPMADEYKSKGVTASPIRVIQLLYNSGVSFLDSHISVSLNVARFYDGASFIKIDFPLTTVEFVVAIYRG